MDSRQEQHRKKSDVQMIGLNVWIMLRVVQSDGRCVIPAGFKTGPETVDSRQEQHRKKNDVQMFGLNVWNA